MFQPGARLFSALACNSAQGPCWNPNSWSATATCVAGDYNDDASNNNINQATCGVASASSTTVAKNESLFNVVVPAAGFKSFHMRPVPKDPAPPMYR